MFATRRFISASCQQIARRLLSTCRQVAVRRLVVPSGQNVARRLMSTTSTTSPSLSPKTMFCQQCEQTENGTGCTTVGVCGKTPTVAALQDLLVYALKGISVYANLSAKLGSSDIVVDNFVFQSLFSTLTNVNFDASRFQGYLREAHQMKQRALENYKQAAKKAGVAPVLVESGAGTWKFNENASIDELVIEGRYHGIEEMKSRLNADFLGLQELIMYGLKGLCAYAEHAFQVGKHDLSVFAFVHDCLSGLSTEKLSVDELFGMALNVGKFNLRVTQLLNEGHTERYGSPVPTPVHLNAKKGKCILISGHDLRDLEELLKQTEGKDINVYTHGEMLPAHGYPGLKKYSHLIGNYGGPWQNQKFDFSAFPGPIVMTTNCLIEPRKSYKDRLFTRSVVGWEGVTHIPTQDYSQVIQSALKCDGFKQDEAEKTILTGFGHNAVLSVADKVIDAVKAGKIDHFFLIGGCDGSESERSYFKDLAQLTPKSSIILTLGCAKYRFNKLDLGTVEGIPRVLDVGQCNDAYSAVQIAVALAGAFKTDVNSLPLSFAISWLEQKAVAVLLTLLHLNIQGIRLGPNLPAFLTPNLIKILNDKYKIQQIGEPSADLKAFLAKK